MERLSPENPLYYQKGHTSDSSKSNPHKHSDNPSFKLKESLKLDLRPKPIVKNAISAKAANKDRMQTVQAFASETSTQNPELAKKAKLFHSRINLNDSLKTVEFHKALKEETLRILNQQRAQKGTMFVKELWGRNYYSNVVKKSGIEKILDDMRKMHWQNQDKVLDILDNTYNTKHQNDLGHKYMDYLVEKYRQKYGNHPIFGTPGDRSITTSRRNSVHVGHHLPPHHQHSNSHRENTHSRFYTDSTAAKSPGPKLKLPNINDKSSSEYFVGSPISNIPDIGSKSTRHSKYNRIHQLISPSSQDSHLNHDAQAVPNWMEDSISHSSLESSRNYFHENDVFWAEIEEINDQCDSAREDSKSLKKKIESLEKFMHMALAKDRTIKVSFAQKMKADTIKDFQSLLKQSEKYEDAKLKEIKNNFQKRRDEIIKQAMDNPHKHSKPIVTKVSRPEFRVNAK